MANKDISTDLRFIFVLFFWTILRRQKRYSPSDNIILLSVCHWPNSLILTLVCNSAAHVDVGKRIFIPLTVFVGYRMLASQQYPSMLLFHWRGDRLYSDQFSFQCIRSIIGNVWTQVFWFVAIILYEKGQIILTFKCNSFPQNIHKKKHFFNFVILLCCSETHCAICPTAHGN